MNKMDIEDPLKVE